MKKIFLLCILVLLGAFSASAQFYRYLETKDGLSSRRVISIEKDSKGYMWFLTQEGVDRYNGKQYIHYKLYDGEKTIQHFPNLSHIHVDGEGGIWVLGKNGYVFKYNSYSDKIPFHIINFSAEDKKLGLLHSDAEVVIWFSSAYKGTPESQSAAKKHT